MTEARVIAVVGATGAQGGGLVRAILADPDGGFVPRAITRDPAGEKATCSRPSWESKSSRPIWTTVRVSRGPSQELTASSASPTSGSTSRRTRRSSRPATRPRQPRQPVVRHAIWSSLEDTRRFVTDDRMPNLQEKYKVPHFDAKEVAEGLFREAGVPTTVLRTAFYWENFVYFGLGPQRGEDGVLAITFPLGSARMPSMAAEDIGKIAYGIFKRGDELIGQTISVAGDHPTGAEFAQKLGAALGEEVRYNDIDPDVYRSFDFPAADELGNMFQFKRDFEAEYVGARDLEVARSLNPELQDFDAWLAANSGRIPVTPKE